MDKGSRLVVLLVGILAVAVPLAMGTPLVYAKADKALNVLVIAWDEFGHWSSTLGLIDGLARRGHNVTVAIPTRVQPWWDDFRAVYENEDLQNLSAADIGEGPLHATLGDLKVRANCG